MTICQHTLWVKLQHIDWKKYWNTYCKGLKAKYTRNYSKSSNKIASIIAMAGKRYIMACQKKTQIPSKHEKMLNLPNNHHNQMETLHTIFTHQTDKICENIKYLWGSERKWWSFISQGLESLDFTISLIFFQEHIPGDSEIPLPSIYPEEKHNGKTMTSTSLLFKVTKNQNPCKYSPEK